MSKSFSTQIAIKSFIYILKHDPSHEPTVSSDAPQIDLRDPLSESLSQVTIDFESDLAQR